MLADVVAYAQDRGVRVMLEIDTPGHTAAFRYGYPDVVTDWFVNLPSACVHYCGMAC